ncbi:MAG: hypothetical protein K1X66_06530, partial [Verrucomicrobiae bacterium]|nr:hypothetical protein [Verrucomicrobiae bacterium]
QGEVGPTGPPGTNFLNAPAGGDLTGTYPDPQIRNNSITSNKIVNGSVNTSKFATLPTVRAIFSVGAQFISSGVSTLVNFPDESFDTANMHGPLNLERITAPVSGYYQVMAQVTWNSNSNGRREITILFNGVSSLWSNTVLPISGSSTAQNCFGLLKLDAGDVVTLQVFQNSGVSLAVTGASLAMHWVSPL